MIIADACTVILLAKASVLEKSAASYDLRVTNEVYKEVMEGKQKQFPDAYLTERLEKERKIKTVSASSSATRKIMHDFNMGDGEASTVAFAVQEKVIVATDNRQGRKTAEIYGLPLIGSIEIVISLAKKKKISKEKAQEALKILQERGWFSPYLIEKSMEDLP